MADTKTLLKAKRLQKKIMDDILSLGSLDVAMAFGVLKTSEMLLELAVLKQLQARDKIETKITVSKPGNLE